MWLELFQHTHISTHHKLRKQRPFPVYSFCLTAVFKCLLSNTFFFVIVIAKCIQPDDNNTAL